MPGVDVNCEDTYERTALWYAAAGWLSQVVQLLLAVKGIQSNCRSMGGITPLSIATLAAGAKDTVEDFLPLCHSGIVDPNSEDEFGQTPLMMTAIDGHTEIVKCLLAIEGVNPNAKNSWGRTPLLIATKCNQPEVIEHLLSVEGSS